VLDSRNVLLTFARISGIEICVRSIVITENADRLATASWTVMIG
jgi:hypothetical protein